MRKSRIFVKNVKNIPIELYGISTVLNATPAPVHSGRRGRARLKGLGQAYVVVPVAKRLAGRRSGGEAKKPIMENKSAKCGKMIIFPYKRVCPSRGGSPERPGLSAGRKKTQSPIPGYPANFDLQGPFGTECVR